MQNFLNRGFSNEFPEWASIRATFRDNPSMSETDVDEARKVCPRPNFDRNMKLTFNTYEGQIWNFNHEKCIADNQELEL